jgi:hypothetical protein
MYYTLFAKGTAIVVIHFPKTNLKRENITYVCSPGLPEIVLYI